MFQSIGTLEVLVIAIVIIVLFGGKRLPEFARNLASALKELRSALMEKPTKQDK